MPETGAAQLLREVLDALTAHDLDRLAAAVDERIEFEDVGGGEKAHGRDEWRAFCGRFIKAFPDLSQDVTHLVAAGESAFAEVIARGTHTGPLETPDGDIPPSGRSHRSQVLRRRARPRRVARRRARVLRLGDSVVAARAPSRVRPSGRLSRRKRRRPASRMRGDTWVRLTARRRFLQRVGLRIQGERVTQPTKSWQEWQGLAFVRVRS